MGPTVENGLCLRQPKEHFLTQMNELTHHFAVQNPSFLTISPRQIV